MAGIGSCCGSHMGSPAPVSPPCPSCWCLKQLWMGPKGEFWVHGRVQFHFFLCLCHPPAQLPGMGPVSGPALTGHHTTLWGAPHCGLGCSMPHVGVQHACCGSGCSILGLTGWPEEGVTTMRQADFSL